MISSLVKKTGEYGRIRNVFSSSVHKGRLEIECTSDNGVSPGTVSGYNLDWKLEFTTVVIPNAAQSVHCPLDPFDVHTTARILNVTHWPIYIEF